MGLQRTPPAFMGYSFISSPAEQDPGGGLRSPRKDRGGRSPERAWSGAEGDCAAGTRSCGGRPLAGCQSVEQDGPGAAVGFDVGGVFRGGRAGLRNKSADLGGAMRSAGLWAARRGERPWREPSAYADRMSRSTFDSLYSRNRDSSITVPSRACICESGGGGVGTGAIGSERTGMNGARLRACIYGGGEGCMSTGIEGGSAGAGISGSTGSLGRARTFRRSGWDDVGGALCWGWMTNTGCRSM